MNSKKRSRRIKRTEIGQVYEKNFNVDELLWRVDRLAELIMISKLQKEQLEVSIAKTGKKLEFLIEDLELLQKDFKCPTQ